MFAVLLGGCIHNSNHDVVPTGCVGRQDVAITNNWSEQVEVFTRIGASPVELYVGSVGPGRREQFRLPDGARYAYPRPMGATSPNAAIPRASQDLIDLRYLCE